MFAFRLVVKRAMNFLVLNQNCRVPYEDNVDPYLEIKATYDYSTDVSLATTTVSQLCSTRSHIFHMMRNI